MLRGGFWFTATSRREDMYKRIVKAMCIEEVGNEVGFYRCRRSTLEEQRRQARRRVKIIKITLDGREGFPTDLLISLATKSDTG